MNFLGCSHIDFFFFGKTGTKSTDENGHYTKTIVAHCFLFIEIPNTFNYTNLGTYFNYIHAAVHTRLLKFTKNRLKFIYG